MDVGMPFNLVVIVWMMAIGAALWRHEWTSRSRQ
jgi:hypothetical protein